jgi:hypothetical protein
MKSSQCLLMEEIVTKTLRNETLNIKAFLIVLKMYIHLPEGQAISAPFIYAQPFLGGTATSQTSRDLMGLPKSSSLTLKNQCEAR